MPDARGTGRPPLAFTREQYERLAPRIVEELRERFGVEATGLEARGLLKAFAELAGDAFYDRGVGDAIAQLGRSLEDAYALMRGEPE